ncbi:MAG: helix-turn-helix transcriptional regulator [Thermoplasmataceae archaeon]
MIPPQPASSEMTFAPCVNCAHEAAASGELVKHTNVDTQKRRFFTRFCQVCKCDKPAIQAKEVLVVEAKKEPETISPVTPGSAGLEHVARSTNGKISSRETRKCGECPFEGTPQALMLHATKNHPFPTERLITLLHEKKTIPEIAELLHRSRSTVAYHVAKIRAPENETEKKIPGSSPESKDEQKKGPEESPRRIAELEGEIASLKKALNEAVERVKKGEEENDHEALLHDNEVLRKLLTDARNQIQGYEEQIAKLHAGNGDNGHPGILRSRVMISAYGAYYDSQKKLISETIKEYVYHAGKGKTITMEVRQLEDLLRVVVEISGGPAE